MTPGIIIEGVSRDELIAKLDGILSRLSTLEQKVENDNRTDYTLTELARRKGYSKAQMRRIIRKKSIPFTYDGREMIVAKEYAGQIKAKA